MTSALAPAAAPSPGSCTATLLGAVPLGLKGFTQPRPPKEKAFRKRGIAPVQGERVQQEYISRQGFRKNARDRINYTSMSQIPPRGPLMLPDQWFFNFWGDKGPFETLMKVMPPLPGEGLQATPPPHTHTWILLLRSGLCMRS